MTIKTFRTWKQGHTTFSLKITQQDADSILCVVVKAHRGGMSSMVYENVWPEGLDKVDLGVLAELAEDGL